MDPLSIACGCVSLAAGVTNLLTKITLFALEVRAARKDMEAVSRELISLKMALNALEDDDQKRRLNFPTEVIAQINEILKNIELVTSQISQLLNKLSSGRLGRRIQWAVAEKSEMNSLRSSLESNKTCLEVALNLGTISILAAQTQKVLDNGRDINVVVQQTQTISVTTTRIDQNVQDISSEISDLKSQLSNLATQKGMDNFVMQSEAYKDILLEPLRKALSDAQSQSATAPQRKLSVLFGDNQLVASTSPKEFNCLECASMRRELQQHEEGIEFLKDKLKNEQSRYKILTTEHDILKASYIVLQTSLEAWEANPKQMLEEVGNVSASMPPSKDARSSHEQTPVSLGNSALNDGVVTSELQWTPLNQVKSTAESGSKADPFTRQTVEELLRHSPFDMDDKGILLNEEPRRLIAFTCSRVNPFRPSVIEAADWVPANFLRYQTASMSLSIQEIQETLQSTFSDPLELDDTAGLVPTTAKHIKHAIAKTAGSSRLAPLFLENAFYLKLITARGALSLEHRETVAINQISLRPSNVLFVVLKSSVALAMSSGAGQDQEGITADIALMYSRAPEPYGQTPEYDAPRTEEMPGRGQISHSPSSPATPSRPPQLTPFPVLEFRIRRHGHEISLELKCLVLNRRGETENSGNYVNQSDLLQIMQKLSFALNNLTQEPFHDLLSNASSLLAYVLILAKPLVRRLPHKEEQYFLQVRSSSLWTFKNLEEIGTDGSSMWLMVKPLDERTGVPVSDSRLWISQPDMAEFECHSFDGLRLPPGVSISNDVQTTSQWREPTRNFGIRSFFAQHPQISDQTGTSDSQNSTLIRRKRLIRRDEQSATVA